VKAAKMGVNHWNAKPGNTIPVFGVFFRALVKQFQTAHTIPASGVIGPATWEALLPHMNDIARNLLEPPVDSALAKARKMLAYCRLFDGPYVYGGEHDRTLADDTPHGNFDCSSSTSLLMYRFGILGSDRAQVSEWFESWGQSGRGKYVTVHANGDHVWTEFSLPEGYFRFDTSPHGDGPRGPRVRTSRRFDSSFVHRHPAGM
jgi:hypothetical protein